MRDFLLGAAMLLGVASGPLSAGTARAIDEAALAASGAAYCSLEVDRAAMARRLREGGFDPDDSDHVGVLAAVTESSRRRWGELYRDARTSDDGEDRLRERCDDLVRRFGGRDGLVVRK